MAWSWQLCVLPFSISLALAIIPAESRHHPPTTEEKRRVLAAFHNMEDWQAVAKHNGLARATAWRVVNLSRAEKLQCGGARAARTKVTPTIVAALEEYVD